MIRVRGRAGPIRWHALALGLLAACSPDQRPTNVLLISLDTTRADALGCYGGPPDLTPAIDELARRGWLFERAYSPVPLTLPAHASLFTGRYPREHGVHNNNSYRLPEQEVTLAERLRAAGYQTGAFVGAYVLASPYGLAQGFERYDADFDEEVATSTFAERPASEVADAALRWLDERDRARPFFAWVHFYDAHYPYLAPAGRARSWPELYQEEVHSCDLQVARLVGALEREGCLEDTLIVVTSDHGEALGEHAEATHGYFLYEGSQRVPLIFCHPRLRAGERRAQLVSLLDVTPSVLAFLGLEAPPVSGHDRLARDPVARQADASEVVLLETELPRIDFALTPLRALVDERFKFIQAPEPELYELARDPHERENLAERMPELVRERSRRLEQLGERERADARFRPDQESTRRLIGLGYASGVESELTPRADWDTRELARWIELRNAGLEHFYAGRMRAAIEAMQRLVDLCESSHDGQLYLGLALTERGDFARACPHLERATQLQPESSTDAWWNLAVCLHELGREAEIPAALRRVIRIRPEHAAARQKLAEIALRERDYAGAREHLLVLRESASGAPEGEWASRILSSMKREP